MKAQLKNHQILLFSLLLLSIGSLYYLLFRDPIMASSLFGLEALHIGLSPPMFDALPSFVHQLALVLLTWLVLHKKHMWSVILFWLFVNSLFELGQLLSAKDNTYYLPQVLETYFHNGTYSHGDIIAIFLATFVAYIIIKNQKGN